MTRSLPFLPIGEIRTHKLLKQLATCLQPGVHTMAKQAWDQNSSDNWRSLQQHLLFTCPLISYLSRKEGVWSLLLALSWCPAFSITPSSEESKWRCSLMLAGHKQWKVPSSVRSGKRWLRCVLQQSKVQLEAYDTTKLIINMYLLCETTECNDN